MKGRGKALKIKHLISSSLRGKLLFQTGMDV
jgi:hypothetical protein